MTLPDKIKQRTIDKVIDNISNLEDYSKRFAKVAIPVLTLVAGTALLASYLDLKRISNIYNTVNSAPIIEVDNKREARPEDYCRNEIPDNASDVMAYKDACVQIMYKLNPGLKEGKYFPIIKVPDSNEDKTASSKH